VCANGSIAANSREEEGLGEQSLLCGRDRNEQTAKYQSLFAKPIEQRFNASRATRLDLARIGLFEEISGISL
jgi:hypothetical protein